MLCKDRYDLVRLIESPDPTYGDLGHSLPWEMYTLSQAECISLGRGCDPRWGDVSDLKPQSFTGYQMYYVALGRGCDPRYGAVDDLDPRRNSYDVFHIMALARGKDCPFLGESKANLIQVRDVHLLRSLVALTSQ